MVAALINSTHSGLYLPLRINSPYRKENLQILLLCDSFSLSWNVMFRRKRVILTSKT